MAAILVACVPNQPYRTTVGVCDAPGCKTGSIEHHQVNTEPATEYLLGVVEFDDQGAKYAPQQMNTLFDMLKAESATQDLGLVVFVHGWENNASYDNGNVQEFRKLLERLARTESEHPPGAWGKPRKVVGIYAGWRGQLWDAGDVSAVTFWDRKEAAQRVALGSIRELLGRARGLRDTLDRTTLSGRLLPTGAKPPADDPFRSTRLLVIGHSFGGLIVYTALAQYFTDRAAASDTAYSLGATQDDDKVISSYGDLVVIVNPAVEAISWQPIRELVANRKPPDFARGQKPVFVEVTSQADEATGTAFPLGRSLNTLTENFTDAAEKQMARQTIGHYEPFLTHDLTSAPDMVTRQQSDDQLAWLAKATPNEARKAAQDLVWKECQAHAAFDADYRRDGYLSAGWTRHFSSGAILTHRAASEYDPNDPFWIVNADKSLIAGHSDIEEPVFVDFVRQLYDELLLDGDTCNAPP